MECQIPQSEKQFVKSMWLVKTFGLSSNQFLEIIEDLFEEHFVCSV